MKVSIGIGGAASGRKRDFDEQVDYVVEAEKLGVDAVWTAEAWGQDAISPLAYIAARTSRIRLGTGIMQISARVPVMTAMTALKSSLDHHSFSWSRRHRRAPRAGRATPSLRASLSFRQAQRIVDVVYKATPRANYAR